MSMTNRCTRATGLVLIGALAALVSSCSDTPEEAFTAVTLNGEVKMSVGPMPPGTLYFRLYNLESLEGELQHPLHEIEDFQSDSPVFTHTFEYPLHMGEGLAIHAWLDVDGDGIFCTPSKRLDPSALEYTETTPEGEINMTITLTENCRAANFFYPPMQ
ncbi:MAG: hypothetical protein E2O50_01965 [Gammaproteobacteria bacterium]|nr:MAG: hypothetical protein E2O50_01965 [Gammaproteobacteria bacterium]